MTMPPPRPRPHAELLSADLAPAMLETIDTAARDAATAFAAWQDSTGLQRARLLHDLVEAFEATRDELVAFADQETALGVPRLQGVLSRTNYQLRRFGDLAAQRCAFRAADDPAVPLPPPAGHPALRRLRAPVRRVAVFAASNLPFAFPVAGGDTASALAAGCPVVVKAHPAHPCLSVRMHELMGGVLRSQRLPSGLVGLVQGAGPEVGTALVRHPAIAAGASAGSTRGGAALAAEADRRPRPIPFCGERLDRFLRPVALQDAPAWLLDRQGRPS